MPRTNWSSKKSPFSGMETADKITEMDVLMQHFKVKRREREKRH